MNIRCLTIFRALNFEDLQEMIDMAMLTLMILHKDIIRHWW